MSIFGREVAVWIGILGTIILGAVQTLVGEGIISDALQGQIKNAVESIVQIAVLASPLIAGLFIRQGVTPVSAPQLPVGTVVTTPNGGSAKVTPS